MASRFDAERSAVLADGREQQVGVNQRALIDKILARYATPHSTYRELLQNSNDASATRAEVRFTTARADAPGAASNVVCEAVYRNNGAVFSPEDWARLTTIASGNPNPDHIGFFGVGAFTLFSIAEEPMVVSGRKALVFKWKGDALFTKVASRKEHDSWTSFILPARDPYLVPNLEDFGEFLSNSLTFTTTLKCVEVFVDGESVLEISKSTPTAPTVITPPAERSWWNPNAADLTSPRKIFGLQARDGSLTDTRIKVAARYGSNPASRAQISARVVSVQVITKVPPELRKRMVRVTKKEPPAAFSLKILLPDVSDDDDHQAGDANTTRARAVLAKFSPRLGAGRVYIGFRTSQTTGVACHVAAPLIPTVEREAIDLVDPTLAIWNSDLLHMAGVVMRLALEHGMAEVGALWTAEASQREASEDSRLSRVQELVRKLSESRDDPDVPVDAGKAREPTKDASSTSSKNLGIFSGFASFMGQAASEVKRIASVAVSAVTDDSANLLSASDSEPLCQSERKAIVLMRSFEPAQSSPDTRVGSLVARGFESCLPSLGVPVITQAGILRGNEAYLPFNGIERFFTKTGAPLVRNVVVGNAREYVRHVCGVQPVSISVLADHLKTRVMSEDELLLLLIWFCQFARRNPDAIASVVHLKGNITVAFKRSTSSSRLRYFTFYVPKEGLLAHVPLPSSTLPYSFSRRIPERIVHDGIFSSWFAPLPWREWAFFIADHAALTAPRSADADDMRGAIFSALASEFSRRASNAKHQEDVAVILKRILGHRRCMPTESGGIEVPGDVYLPEAELSVFSGVNLTKVSSFLMRRAFVTSSFLTCLGVREAVSIDVLLSELESLSWNKDPSGLIQYLCSVSAKMTSEEWSRLQRTKFLPSVADDDLHAPSELCLPVRELRSLPLPFLKWNGVLTASSAEVEVLCGKLAVKRSPPLGSVLALAADETVDEAVRAQCIWFVAKRLDDPSGEYRSELSANPSVFSKRFLPCSRLVTRGAGQQTESRLCLPSECYIKASSASLGFWTVAPQFERASMAFHVKQEPTGRQYVQALLDQTRIAKAAKELSNAERSAMVWRFIDLLAAHVGSIGTDERKSLQATAFVPILREDGSSALVWRRPADIYFGEAARSESAEVSALTQSLFDVVPQNDLLRAVGVKDEPNLVDLCQVILANPDEVYSKLSTPERYEQLLQRIASQVAALPREYISRLKRCPFLLATQLKEEDTAGSQKQALAGESEERLTVQRASYVLACAGDIVIVDDAYLQRMFKPLCAPLDSALEAFYSRLGSEYISRKVTRRFRLLPENQRAISTTLTQELTDRVLQRKALILETSNRGLTAGAESLFLEGCLQIREVQEILSVYTLSGKSCSQRVTCCASSQVQGRPPFVVPRVPPQAKLILYCTSDVDFFDVANSIGRQIYARCGLQDVFLLAQLLETTLAQLRARGFPVDRIVQASQSSVRHENNVNSPPEDTTESKSRASNALSEPNDLESKSGPEQILLNMFPDIDQDWLAEAVKEHPGDNGLRDLKSMLDRRRYPKAGESSGSRLPPRSTNPPRGSSLGASRDSQRNTLSDESSVTASGSSGKHPLGRSLMKALRKRTQSVAGLKDGLSGRDSSGMLGGGVHGLNVANSGSVPAHVQVDDESAHRGTKDALKAAVSAAAAVPPGGVVSPSTTVVPHGAASSKPQTCEIISGQNLMPLRTDREARTTNHGFRVFVSKLDEDVTASVRFCSSKWDFIEIFSGLLSKLVSVYGVNPRSVAIFYAKGGNTIAFNANGCLHFNLRYFLALHSPAGNSALSLDAYIYWYTTFAHELSHNLVKEHNQQHGHFTECFVTEYFGGLLQIIPEQEQ